MGLRGEVFRRLAFTLIVSIGALLLARITLPGLDASVVERLTANAPHPSDPSVMGFLALGLDPFIYASLLIELLALAVPQWRRWRLGGYPERENLWAWVKLVALALALIKAFFVIRAIQHVSDDLPASLGVIDVSRQDDLVFGAQLLSLIAGVYLLYWLTRLVDRYGTGNGFSVILLAFMVRPRASEVLWAVRFRLMNGERSLLPYGIAVVAVAVVTRLAGGGSLRPASTSTRVEALPTPSSGLRPGVTAWAIVQLPTAMARLGIWDIPRSLASDTWTRRGFEMAFTAVFCALFAWAFNQPRVVAQAWYDAGVPLVDEAETLARARAACARGFAHALAICCGLLAAEWFCAESGLRINLIGVTIIACVAMDVAGELRFRAKRGEVVGVWPVHRLYLLPPLLRALDAAEIPAFPRGRRYRTLWNFFAPFVPVEILVPVADARRAEAILRQRTGNPEPPPLGGVLPAGT